MTDEELARTAYEAYATKHMVLMRNYEQIVDRPIRPWADLTDEMRRCWKAAVTAVVDALS